VKGDGLHDTGAHLQVNMLGRGTGTGSYTMYGVALLVVSREEYKTKDECGRWNAFEDCEVC
jgi:hypothetical protein